MSGFRLKNKGIYINQSNVVEFTFDGKKYAGFEGDSLASAMLANGTMLFGRSFKYHRPRGVLSAGPEEPNALVALRNKGRHEPNCLAPMVELYDGLIAKSQNAWPSLDFDVMAINQFFSPLLISGFYYKTFMGTGQKFWHFCEHFIRRAAGMGKASLEADPDRYEKNNIFTDILIIGAGAAGLIAAHQLSKTGAKILVVDENRNLGGSLPEERGTINGCDALNWASEIIKELATNDNVTIKSRTTVYGYFDDNVLGAIERVADHKLIPENFEPRQRHHKIFAKRVIVATGSIERPLIFSGNDIPGVMLANSALRYANRYGVAIGEKVIVFTNNDDGYNSALQLKTLGVNIVSIIDPRLNISFDLNEKIQQAKISCYLGFVVVEAKGNKSLKKINIASFEGDQKSLTKIQSLEADCLLISGGYTPNINLCSQTGTPAVFNDEIQSFIPGPSTRSWDACGAVVGDFDLQSALLGGAEAAKKVITNLGLNHTKPLSLVIESQNSKAIPFPLTEIPSPKYSAKKFIDFQHDVTVSDLNIAHVEGFHSVEHLKRYTTMGMAADQGKTSNMNALALMAEARGITIPEAGTTRFRAPYVPISLGALAGRNVAKNYQAKRHTPLHDWHIENGADMIEAGIWYRPRVYKKKGESLTEAYIREASIVRSKVGMVDVTSLGKIDVQGPDAAEFLNRVYANPFLKVPVGKARYGVMLREDGYIFDDGTCWRLSETQFLMTTTTANAAKVLSELERLLCIVWPDLKVHVTSVTDQWAGMALAGPDSAKLLKTIVRDIVFSEEEFPFMAVRDGKINHLPVKIARLSFSGERAYEIYTASNYGFEVWTSIMEAGKKYNITPYGTEALGTLRIEKGHISGPELDGRTTMDDVGLGRMASKSKNYVGSVLKNREGLVSPERIVMVGLVSLENKPILAGSIVMDGSNSIGHVTSTTYSPPLGKHIALALIKRGSEKIGSDLTASFPLKKVKNKVHVVDSCFYDKEGKQLYV